MSKALKILALLLFAVTAFNAQTRKADSLRSIIKTQKEDSNMVRSLIALAESLENVSDQDAMLCAKKGLDLSRKINYKKGELRSGLWYALCLTNLGKTKEAQAEFDKIRKSVENSKDQEALSDLYFGLGALCEKQNALDGAIKNYSLSIDLRKSALQDLSKQDDEEAYQKAEIRLGKAYLNMADACENFSKPNEAIEFYKLSIPLLKDGNAKWFLSFAYNNLGVSYLNTGDYKTALQNHLEALKIKNELKDTAGIAHTHHNIGNVYFNTGDYKAALKNYYTSLQYGLLNNDLETIVMLYSNIGVVHEYMGDLDKAFENYESSLKQAEKINNEEAVSSCYVNMANVLIKQGDELIVNKKAKEANEKYNQALTYQAKALNIYKNADNQASAVLLINTGALYQRLKKYDKARECYKKSLQLSQEGNHIRELSYTYANLCELDSLVGDYKGALRNYKQYIVLRDSLINEESTKKIVELQMQSDFDKKETESRLMQEKKDEITQKEISHQKQQRNLSLLAVALFAMMAIFIFRGYKQKQKANELLEEKNELIATQKHLVEEKNKEITDSINYAKRLQKAILASDKTMRSVFEQSFILYKPKDIVSGDFYWILHTEDRSIQKNIFAFAAADCTGHGVPGAFMSMLNSTLLNQTAYNSDITTPADALNFLNQELPKNLRSPDDTENIQDGMDIAFCLVDLNKKILKYSGANNPCWVVRDGEVIELKPTKQAITASNEYDKKKFTDEIFPLKKDDCVYIFTDGYADQFGGPKGKKFKYKTLSDLLVSINKETLDKQKEILEQQFMEWKGSLEQVDDVLIMGIKIT